MGVVFFFSSRRRHTRCSRDWSSDVCSSDLVHEAGRKAAPRLAAGAQPRAQRRRPRYRPAWQDRSEEHTSELQSRLHLVCRLLLETKKKKIHIDASDRTTTTDTHGRLSLVSR